MEEERDSTTEAATPFMTAASNDNDRTGRSRWLHRAGWLLVAILVVIGSTLEYTAINAWENSRHYAPDRAYALGATMGGIACLTAAALGARLLRLGTVRPAWMAVLQSVVAVALGPVLFIPVYLLMLLVIMVIVAVQNVLG